MHARALACTVESTLWSDAGPRTGPSPRRGGGAREGPRRLLLLKGLLIPSPPRRTRCRAQTYLSVQAANKPPVLASRSTVH